MTTINLQSVETPTTVLLPIVRGTNRRIIFTTYQSIDTSTLYTSLTGALVSFELKKIKDPQAVNLFKKATANNGGGSNEIEVDSSSQMSVYVIPADTDNLSQTIYWALITITAGTNVEKVWLQIPFD